MASPPVDARRLSPERAEEGGVAGDGPCSAADGSSTPSPRSPETPTSSRARVASPKSSLGSGSSSLPQSPISTATKPESVNNSQPIEIEDDDPEEEDMNVGSKRKLTSAVWKEFKRVRMLGEVKAKCMYCGKKLSAKSNSATKHLHDHLKGCPYHKSKFASKDNNMTQTSLRFASKESGLAVQNYSFDPDIARRELAAMIILYEYPLSMVDHTGFRRFVSALQPLFKLVTRNTVRKDIMDAYMEEKKKALQYMSVSKSRVSITTDMWTSENQKRGYMAVTAHFIDDSWTLRNIIMRFIYVPAPHTAEVISEVLYEALVEWNLDEKITTVTLDNCNTNDALIPELVRKIGKGKLSLEGKLLHMRCCAHILNLIVKDGLDVIQPAIAKIRDSVAFWTATPKRVEKFEEIAKYVKVSTDNKLGLDCKTRWNSTYKMLKVALPYESAFNRAARVEKLYVCAPSKEEWDFAREVVGRLKMFDDILDWWKVAGTRYPTLSKIARDIFAIPVSTVASESAFSTSGRVLSEHRSRLTPEILEALICSQDWMHRKYIDATNVDKPETFWSCLQEMQEGMQKLLL